MIKKTIVRGKITANTLAAGAVGTDKSSRPSSPVDIPRSRGLAVHHPAGHPVDVDVGVVGAAHGDRH